jgi:homoserine kinase type II
MSAPAVCVRDLQLIHGDYQLTNLLFEGDAISAVIDWDKSRAASPFMEVVRCLDHGLGLAPDHSAAFLMGYRACRPLSESQLAAALEYWTHQQARSLWVLGRICLAGTAGCSVWRPRFDRL